MAPFFFSRIVIPNLSYEISFIRPRLCVCYVHVRLVPMFPYLLERTHFLSSESVPWRTFVPFFGYNYGLIISDRILQTALFFNSLCKSDTKAVGGISSRNLSPQKGNLAVIIPVEGHKRRKATCQTGLLIRNRKAFWIIIKGTGLGDGERPWAEPM